MLLGNIIQSKEFELNINPAKVSVWIHVIHSVKWISLSSVMSLLLSFKKNLVHETEKKKMYLEPDSGLVWMDVIWHWKMVENVWDVFTQRLKKVLNKQFSPPSPFACFPLCYIRTIQLSLKWFSCFSSSPFFFDFSLMCLCPSTEQTLFGSDFFS